MAAAGYLRRTDTVWNEGIDRHERCVVACASWDDTVCDGLSCGNPTGALTGLLRRRLAARVSLELVDHYIKIDAGSKSARRSSSTLSQGAHPNRAIPGKHAGNGDPSRSLPMRALVQAPVSVLEVSRSAPRMNDQKPYPRLNSPGC
jgi:hypothetical protein